MNKTIKVITILCLLFGLKLFSSCIRCNCEDEFAYFRYSEATISNIDNNGTYAKVTTSDTLNNSAVAFLVKLNVHDTLYSQTKPNFSFITNANAWQCRCPYYLIPQQKIEKVEIITLLDINSEIKANTIITDKFVWRDNEFFNNNLYKDINILADELNKKYFEYEIKQQFALFLKTKVENKSARFNINIYLSDNEVLSVNTNLLTIR